MAAFVAALGSAVIAGGGLAGLACGIRLRGSGWDVEIHERHHYPLKKVCGEFLSGDGMRRCRELGVDLDARPLRRARFYFSRTGHFDFNLLGGAWGIRREELDSALAGRFRELGGRLIEGSLYAAPATVAATGRAQIPGLNKWIGWKGYLQGADAADVLQGCDLVMIPLERGYAGLCPVENGEVSVCLVARTPARIPDLLAGHPLLERLSAKIRPHASIAGFDFVESRLLGSIGDAARVWPPVVGDGMNRALKAGLREADRLLGLERDRDAGSEQVQFFLSKAVHSLMLSPTILALGGPVLKRFPSLPEAFFSLSRG